MAELNRLIQSSKLKSNFDEFVEEVLKYISKKADVSSTSFWLLDKEQEKFVCVREFDSAGGSFSRGQIISKAEKEGLFEICCKENILSHELYATDCDVAKLVSRSTESWLSIASYVDGRLLGFLRIDSEVEQLWDDRLYELMIAMLSLIQQSHKGNSLSEKMEFEGSVKTSEYLRDLEQKFSEYGYYTVHNIRHPLTNLISLVDMMKDQDEGVERTELVNLIRIEAMKLDDVVRVMTAKLETE